MTIASERIEFEAALNVLFAGLGGSVIINQGTISANRQAIINYVKAKLDELIPTGEGLTFNLSSAPNVSDPLSLLISAHLEESTKDVCLSAPLNFLVPTLMDGLGVPFENDSKIGWLALPPNYLRLSTFKMKDWERSITKTISPMDAEYPKQFTPKRGGVSKPVAVLTWKVINHGALKTLTINAAGSGFNPGVNIMTVMGGYGGEIYCTADLDGHITSIDGIKSSGIGYTTPNTLSCTGGSGTGFKVNITAIDGLRRVIEYYSIETRHDIEFLFYIPSQTVEVFVANNNMLLDALAWQCASKIMQITGMATEAKMAQERVIQAYNNLN